MSNLKDRLLAGPDAELDSFDAAVRAAALEKYAAKVDSGELDAAEFSDFHNLHCHTFFSYNYLGWSPTHVALAARLLGLRYCAKIDFDVLDGLVEFTQAIKRLGIKGFCGMESRVFIPEYADREINSPGEPGVAYHMGIGFGSEQVPAGARAYADRLKSGAQSRTRSVVEKVNAALRELTLDFDAEVLPLTPAGNATERHVCSAYRLKAIRQFGGEPGALEFWARVLKLDAAKAAKAAGSVAALEGEIRSKLMKAGGPGYIKPDRSTFPLVSEMNRFVLDCGATPCVAWLNGFSAGEADPMELLKFHRDLGARALAVIPDRNWNFADPVKKAASVKNLYAVLDAAEALGYAINAGTELNSPGNKLVDSFDCAPLSDLLPRFLTGAKKLCK